jgi:hypothetical protein
MRRALLAVVAAVVLLLVGSLLALAQSAQLRLLQPAVVTISQAAPVMVTLGGIVNGQQVTLTAPMTMNVAVQVRLDGAGAAVAASAAPAAQPAASTGTVMTDGRGVPYRVDVGAPFQLTQVTSTANSLGWISIVGEIKNTGPDTLQYVKALVTFYKNGKIVQVGEGYTKLDQIAPGQSAPFEVITMVAADQVNAYTVQVQGRPVR